MAEQFLGKPASDYDATKYEEPVTPAGAARFIADSRRAFSHLGHRLSIAYRNLDHEYVLETAKYVRAHPKK